MAATLPEYDLPKTDGSTALEYVGKSSSTLIYTAYNNMQFSKEIRFDTKQKYTDSDIVLQIQMPGVVIPTPASGTSSFYITIGGITYNWHIDSNGNVWVD